VDHCSAVFWRKVLRTLSLFRVIAEMENPAIGIIDGKEHALDLVPPDQTDAELTILDEVGEICFKEDVEKMAQCAMSVGRNVECGTYWTLCSISSESAEMTCWTPVLQSCMVAMMPSRSWVNESSCVLKRTLPPRSRAAASKIGSRASWVHWLPVTGLK